MIQSAAIPTQRVHVVDVSLQDQHHGSQRSAQPSHQYEPEDDSSPSRKPSERGGSTRGRGATRGGRGVAGRSSTRGARGGRGGRTGPVRGARGQPAGDNDEEQPEDDAEGSNSTEEGVQAGEAPVQPTSSRKDKKERVTKVAKTTPPAVVATPPVVTPVLTGAWVKKPNLTGVVAPPPKPVEAPKSAPTPVQAPATEDGDKAADKSKDKQPSDKTDSKATAKTTQARTSPSKKSQKKKDKAGKKDAKEVVASEVVEVTEIVEVVEEVQKSPKKSDKKGEKKAGKKVESATTTTTTTTTSIAAGWGSLDVGTTKIEEWSTTTGSTAADTKKASTPNAWARGSPLVKPSTPSASPATAASPVSNVIPTIVPGSPKDLPIAQESHTASSASSAASPKQYLKLGRWDTPAATNLSLQFGSFSLNGVEGGESTSPRAWSSTATTATTSSSGVGGKTVTTTKTQNAWSNKKSPSPKKTAATLSPGKALETEQQTVETAQVVGKIAATTTSAPPGLSVAAGGATPKSTQSPRFAPSAPSPASLPKPDEVKRGTPTHSQTQFAPQASGQSQAKMNIGSVPGYGADFSKSANMYQPSYAQYSMDIGRSAGGQAAVAQGQIQSTTGTPKSGPRSGVAVQSPARLPQQAQQQQQQTQAQPQQQQQQPQQQGQQQKQQQQPQQQQQAQQAQQAQQQGQQGQLNQQQQQQLQQAQAHGAMPGYHHYAPPPPPGMAMPYNPYNYGYYQGYGYYQNPQVCSTRHRVASRVWQLTCVYAMYAVPAVQPTHAVRTAWQHALRCGRTRSGLFEPSQVRL